MSDKLYGERSPKGLKEFLNDYLTAPIGQEAIRANWEDLLISYLKGQYILQMEKGEKPHVTLYPELVEEIKRSK